MSRTKPNRIIPGVVLLFLFVVAVLICFWMPLRLFAMSLILGVLVLAIDYLFYSMVGGVFSAVMILIWHPAALVFGFYVLARFFVYALLLAFVDSMVLQFSEARSDRCVILFGVQEGFCLEFGLKGVSVRLLTNPAMEKICSVKYAFGGVPKKVGIEFWKNLEWNVWRLNSLFVRVKQKDGKWKCLITYLMSKGDYLD